MNPRSNCQAAGPYQNANKRPSALNGADNRSAKRLKLAHVQWLWPYVKGHWLRGAIGIFGMLIVSLLSLPSPYIAKVIIDKVVPAKNLRLLYILILVLFGLLIIQFVAAWITNYSFNKFSLEIMTLIKRDLFDRVLRFPMSFFTQNQTGYVISRIGEVEGLGLFFSSTFINFVISLIRFTLCLGILAHLNKKLTLIGLLFLPPLFGITRWLAKDLRQLSWQYYEQNGEISRVMQECLAGIEVVKGFGAETRETDKIHLWLNRLKATSERRTMLMTGYSESVNMIGTGIGFVILWWSGWKITSGEFSVGSYIAFAAYFSQLIGPTQVMANLGLMLQPAKVALQRISDLLNIDTEDQSGGLRAIRSLKGNIELKDVYFEYEATKPIFLKASLIIQAGEKILLTGPNGSGKSTLIKLIMGYCHPQKGIILFGGLPLQDISPGSLRARISVVSQNTFLFSDTVRNNILYSAPESTDQELLEAIRLSGATEFIQKMPFGLDTEIGERGIRLSGGERQKLSIARAILRKSDLVVLDEISTHLDDPSILHLRDLLSRRLKDTTCVVISHRSIEIPLIDHIYCVDRGLIKQVDIIEESTKISSLFDRSQL